MKIALISDLHIGIKKQCPVFMESQLRFFREQFVPELTERGIKNVWVLGDVFDTRQQINTLVINKAIELFRDTLRDFDIDVIVGNHDMYLTTDTAHGSVKPSVDFLRAAEQRTHTRARVGHRHYNNFVFALDRERKQREYPARKRSFAPVAAAAADDNRLTEVALGIIYFKIFAVFEQLFFAREQTHAVIVPAGAAACRAELSTIKRLERGYIFKLVECLLQPAFEIIFHISTPPSTSPTLPQINRSARESAEVGLILITTRCLPLK